MPKLRTPKNPSKHRKIDKNHPEFELAYDMMVGIRTCLSRHELNEEKFSFDLTPACFADGHELNFRGQGTALTPPHTMRDFKFKDYAPKAFSAIRRLFGITEVEYILNICGEFDLLEFVSNSKSGNFFFYSYDKRFMIKTISKDEAKFLRNILPSYYEHLRRFPNSMLNRFFGMHRVKPHKKNEYRFLVMGSVFDTNLSIKKVFDLKGSSLGRAVTRKERKQPLPILKDNDFLEEKQQIHIGTSVATVFREQLAADAKFLENHGIMDYSVLLGIHYRDQAEAEEDDEATERGAVEAVNEKKS
jgi:1-phosphatidylinositol-4-phosphate 5-kinase